MKVLGIKLTHDGSVSLVDNNRLVFCYEMEKLNNMSRFSEYNLSYEQLIAILEKYGYCFDEIDSIVIDGWKEVTNFSNAEYIAEVNLKGVKKQIKLGGYGFLMDGTSVLKQWVYEISDINLKYFSYNHISSHIVGAYYTSPFIKRKENSYILVWDGAIPPQLFYYNYTTNSFEKKGVLFPLVGHIYSLFANKFPPFDRYDSEDLSIAGKLMAYIALGSFSEQIETGFRKIFDSFESEYSTITHQNYYACSCEVIDACEFYIRKNNFSPIDAMATFHIFLGKLLIERLSLMVLNAGKKLENLCYSGGCALNIKWNSLIRNSLLFNDIWIPPFVNDSGSSIGTICCELMHHGERMGLEWSVYSGPKVGEESLSNSWEFTSCSVDDLAEILHTVGEPIVLLNESAELGPRALGNRSILAPAVDPEMKKRLNEIKKREDYRPVAPICIQEDATDVFSPGLPDPYMLFDHQVKTDWISKVPAICHIDNTARLQTVNIKQNPVIYQILTVYKKLSGIPLLCNTSANFNGKGFFPDIISAQNWGKVNFIWSQNKLFFNKEGAEVLRNKSISMNFQYEL